MMAQSTQALQYYQESPELDLSSKSCCRICQEEGEDLITPCNCIGAQAFVHQHCLLAQIEAARIMKVANAQGPYNSRCPYCKFHIEFKLQQYPCSMVATDIRQAFKSLDEDTAASLSLSLPLAIVLFSILIVILSAHLHVFWINPDDFAYKYMLLELFLLFSQYFLVKKIIHKFPRTIRKPVLTFCNAENI